MKKFIALLMSSFIFCSFIPALALQQNDSNNSKTEAIKDSNEDKQDKEGSKSEGNSKDNLKEIKEGGRKIVFLTFDDGPTKNTLKNLEILKAEGVKATFFVIGELAEQNPEILKRVQEEGHEICIHTYNHKTKNYRSKGAYMDDYHKAFEVLSEILGKEPSKFMRMPGGSSTHSGDKYTVKAIRDELYEEGLYYVDWNVSLEDALYENTPVDTLLATFRKELKKHYIDPNNIIVLMHDGPSNKNTPLALPTVIKYFKNNNYEFKTFGNLTQEDFDILLREKQINKYNRPQQTDSSEMKSNPTIEQQKSN